MFKLIKILEEVESPYNGKIQVVQTFEGRRILVGGVSQSGWLVKKVWETALKRLKKYKAEAGEILILGLGGGSITEVVSGLWPNAQMTAVDIDCEMVNMGKKYLDLDKVKNLRIEIEDAEKFVKSTKKKYDFVLIDLYKGPKMPEQFMGKKFVEAFYQLLEKSGVAAFNHLFTQTEKNDALSLEGKLRENFSSILRVYPEANVVYLCFKE